MLIQVLTWFCVLGCALMGGLYFAFSAFVMKALAAVGYAGTRAMNSINTVILRSAFLPLFFGTTIASAVLGVTGALEIGTWRGRLLLIGGVLYVAGMFGVTMICNVPLNNALAAVNAESRTGDAIWRDYVVRWTRWNHVRTACCLLAAAAFMGTVPIC